MKMQSPTALLINSVNYLKNLPAVAYKQYTKGKQQGEKEKKKPKPSIHTFTSYQIQKLR